MKKHILILAAFCILLPVNVPAIPPFVTNFDPKTSKSGAQNWDIIQYKNDWIYFANNQGLLEYDGSRWTTYPISNHTDVRSLYYDRAANRIYAGAFNEFGYYARNENGILHYHSLVDNIAPKDADFSEIWKIYQIDNTLYFQGDVEIFRYKDEQMKRFDFSHEIDCAGHVYNLLVVAVANEGVFFLNGDLFIQLPNSDMLKNKKICGMLPLGNNQILFVTDLHGLFIFDGEKTSVYKTDIDDFLIDNQVFCAAASGSKLAFGTVRGGLVVKDLQTNATTYSNIYSGLQNNTILSLKFDRQENLWLGLDKGIAFVMINSPIYNLLGNSNLYGSGYASLVKENVLYLGTNQGLYATTYPIKSTPELLNIKLLPQIQGQIWSLAHIDNTVFCAANNGAYIIDGYTAKKIQELSGTWKFKKLNSRSGYILGCSYQSFFILEKKQNEWKFRNFVKGFSETGGMFEEDEDGNIWFSHWIKGIFKLRLNEAMDSFESVEQIGTEKGFSTIRNNTLSNINNQIAFSSEGGFFTFNPAENKVEHSAKYEKLFGIHPLSMRLFESPRGDIWALSKSFVDVALRQEDNSFNTHNTQFAPIRNKLIAGFEHLNFVDDKHIIVNTEDGFAWLYVDAAVVPDSFNVSIRNVILTSERDSIVGGFITSQQKIPAFANKHNSIRFEFIAPSFIDQSAIVYSYILENYDSDWSSFSNTNTKEYTKLPKGNYTFRVRAKKISGETISETKYEFTILPAWYQTRIAFIVYSIVLLCLIFLLVTFIKKRSEKGIQIVKEQKDMEIKEQEKQFKKIEHEKEQEITSLKNQRLQYDLRHKSRELASSTMNLIRKNEILLDINQNLDKITDEIRSSNDAKSILKHLLVMQDSIKLNIERDDNWKKFEENFDLVYENYLKRLGEAYSSLTVSDKKLCAYLKMGLSSKDIAPLLNMSFRSVEMSRYRLRKKLDLNREENLTEFLQNF